MKKPQSGTMGLSIVAALFLAVAGTLPLATQEIPASSVMPPGYLQAMPSADRVLADMKVTDSVETRARQYAAVSDLNWKILSVLTEDHRYLRGGGSGLTPEESRLERGYLDAENRLRSGSALVPGLSALMSRYSAETAPFHGQLLDRYFSPAWKAAFETLVRNRDSFRATDSVARVEAASPFRAAPVPLDQRRFVMAVNDWCRQIPAEQNNPIARERAGHEFWQRLGVVVRGVGPIRDWSGILLEIEQGTESLGDPASVTISVDTVSSYGSGEVENWETAREWETATVTAKFSQTSAAYTAAGRMQVGQRVFFSGRALQAEEGQDVSRGDGGEGCRPNFAMRLTELRPAP
jgi:hypothetical protein